MPCCAARRHPVGGTEMPVWYSKRACARDGNDRRNSASAQCVRVDPLAPPPAARAEKLSCIFDATTSTLSTNMTSSPARHPHHPAHRCFGCTCALNTTHPLTVQCCDKNVLCIRRNSPIPLDSARSPHPYVSTDALILTRTLRRIALRRADLFLFNRYSTMRKGHR
jgi:hypothetical protein